jgi:hypothetical protein
VRPLPGAIGWRLQALPSLLGLLALAGCAGAAPPAPAPPAEPRPEARAPYAGPLPAFVTTPEIAADYRWAAPNRAILQHFPCTCGCRDEGHTSNWSCYVQAEKPGGEYVWDPMSAG